MAYWLTSDRRIVKPELMAQLWKNKKRKRKKKTKGFVWVVCKSKCLEADTSDQMNAVGPPGARTQNLLIRSQTPYHWANGPVVLMEIVAL